jgi:hypothetical protein
MNGGGVALSRKTAGARGTAADGGYVELGLGGDYAADGSFTLAFWILKAPAGVWLPESSSQVARATLTLDGSGSHREVVYYHPIRDGLAP